MTEWTSISVTEEQKETLGKEKPDGMAMGAFLVSAIESNSHPLEGKEIVGDVEFEPIVDYEEMAERIGENLERDVDLSPVLNRLDDLQSQLPNDVAGELR